MAKVDEIRLEITRLLDSLKVFNKNDLLKRFPRHESLIGYALKTALRDGVLQKKGVTRGVRYIRGEAVPKRVGDSIAKTYVVGAQGEDDIFYELQETFLKNYSLSENAHNIVSYAFTEMANNAIDHSRSKNIDIYMEVSKGNILFTVRDHGIGAFRNVMENKGLASERLAVAELTKGKVTTAPKWHSGEGIFFTSRAADLFRLTSGKLTMERDNVNGGFRIIENDAAIQGTLVEFIVALDTPRRMAKDVFGRFESEPEALDFGKTEITVNLFKRGDVHVSRSQAKRIMEGLEKFGVVVLDFDGVPFIGQGFADQIFRIFLRENPGTKIIVKNAVPGVRFMIDRVENTQR